MGLRANIYKTILDSYLFVKNPLNRQVSTFLNKSQWMETEEIGQYQDSQLKSLIEYVYAKIPYYRNIMNDKGLTPADITKRSDIVKLPILTKETLKENIERFIPEGTVLDGYKVRTSGGTSGKPMTIVTDSNNDVWENVCFKRGLAFAGFTPGELLVKLFGGSLGLAPSSFFGSIKAKLSGETFLPAFDINENTLEEYLSAIKKSKAKYLRGYTSAIYLLSKLMLDRGVSNKQQAVFPTAETVYGFYRETIEKAFGCKVFEYYGCGEIYSIGFECEDHSGLHISDEHVFVEAVDNENNVPIGEKGKATITTLHNYSFPLIRYQNGDIITLSHEACSCGRGLSKISKIWGRENDFLMSRDGNKVSGAFIPHLFQKIRGAKQFQVLQKEDKSIIVSIVKDKTFLATEENTIRKIISDHLDGIESEIIYCEAIAVPESGKIRSVVSHAVN